MMMKKRHCKLVAFFLLLVLLVPFVPAAPASADVEQPEFPYGVSIYHSTNTGSFALWKVYGSDNVSYVQTYSNVFGDGVAFPVVFRSGLSWTGYYYYINYEKIIDTWDNEGNHIDGGYPWSKNIRIPAPNETTVDSDVYATLVYCTTDIYYGNGYGDDDIYAYQNFVVPGYADPTPTPEPGVSLPDDMPDIENLSLMCKAVCNYGSHFFDGYINPREYVFVYTNYYDDHSSPKAYLWRAPDGNAFGNIFGVGAEGPYFGNLYFYKFNNDTQDLTFLGSLGSSYGYNDGGRVYSAGLSFVEYGFNGRTVLNTCNFDFINLGTTRNFAQKPYFFVYWTNSDITSGENPNGTPSISPTPTAVPTAIPQPSISPTPTDPPETGDDNNYTGLFGWLKRIRDAILSIPKKIVTGILNALKYIFIPDINKVKGVFNTVNNKFGIQHPTKFEIETSELVRPANVVWQFRPISLNGEETEPVDVTIINFEEVDEWLDSSPGMVITRILQAMFGITMFAYAIYIFTKHIATVNYTDAHTLMHLDDPPKGGKGP